MPRKKVLITVTTYPLPSRSYAELVCTAGITEQGEWIRIYPIPLRFLSSLKKDGSMVRTKYTWIKLNLINRSDDFRPESFSPRHYDFRDLEIGDSIDTQNKWQERKSLCLNNVYTSTSLLISDAFGPNSVSLATFKPSEIMSFHHEPDEREWKPTWAAFTAQETLFTDPEENQRRTIRKVPYKFYYKYKDDEGKISRLMIEDWEIGQLFWNCLKRADGNEAIALENVHNKYFDDFVNNCDLYFFLGTRKVHHARRFTNPFGIMGVFYPRK
ncbi:MAG: hypothetical protein GWP19_07240 [Planctomycetia bacterium]|nr:hypothetical protein [Planctomycetia bacterium]